MKKEIVVRFAIAGIHHWPEAQPPVYFLSHPHRHLFFFECKAEVYHCDREIEFLTLSNTIKEFLMARYWNKESLSLQFGPMSCESIARDILDQFPPLNSVSVFEDNENGAVITR